MPKLTTTAAASYPLWKKDYILICLTNLFMFLSLQLIIPTFPAFVDKLGGTDFQIGLVIGVFTISAMLVRPWVGNSLDRGYRRTMLLCGLAAFFLSALSYNLTTSIGVLLLVRFLHGIGWGTSTTAAGTVAADVIPGPRMGEGMGYFGMATALSMASAPAAGIYLINNYTFTHLFFSSAALAVLGLILALNIQYKNPEMTGDSIKPPLYEKSALLPALIMMLVTSTFSAIVSFLILCSTQRGIENIGPFFTVYALVMLVSRPLSGRLVDTKGYNIVVIPGLLLISGTMLTLAVADTIWIFLLGAVFYGLGFGAVQPSMQSLAVRYVAPERRGAANSTFFSAFDLGVGLGAFVWGVTAQLTGYTFMYILASLPALLALLLYYAGMKKKKLSQERFH